MVAAHPRHFFASRAHSARGPLSGLRLHSVSRPWYQKSAGLLLIAGYPAGVVLDAEGLSAAQMQTMAAELGFSESAFVQTSSRADFRLRFFSPTQEVDFCGHATVAAFHALAEQKRLAFRASPEIQVHQETNIGVLPVLCQAAGKIIMTQSAPVFGAIEPDKAKIAALLRIQPKALLDYPLQVVSTGTPKLLIPVDSLHTLQAIQPDLQGIAAYCKAGEARGFYPFTDETTHGWADFQARQFNPLAGINEDPITGIAAGALGCYAAQYWLTHKQHIVVEQGYTMDMGGQMYVDTEGGVKVGGFAVSFGQRELEV